MAFKENLLQKMTIDRLAAQVQNSIAPPDSPQRIDRQAMQELLQMGGYAYSRDRDLDLYRLNDGSDKQLILVLDNELKLFNTTADDVVLRKSPTVKEMVSIRNAIKILNDKDVVVSRKGDTLQRVRNELIDRLDLHYTAADIAALAEDARQALKSGDSEAMTETLVLFAEMLSYSKAPKAFQLPHHQIWGKLEKVGAGQLRMGPLVLFNVMRHTLKMVDRPINSHDKDDMQRYQQIVKGEIKADTEGEAVPAALKDKVLAAMPDLKK